jgi:hypothetical protein
MEFVTKLVVNDLLWIKWFFLMICYIYNKCQDVVYVFFRKTNIVELTWLDQSTLQI